MTTAADAGLTVLVAIRDHGTELDRWLDTFADVPDTQVLVVDDWCHDGTTSERLARHERTGATIVRASRPGRAEAWNAAVDATASPLVALVDETDAIDGFFVAEACDRLRRNRHAGFVLGTGREQSVDPPPTEVTAAALLTAPCPHWPAVTRREVCLAGGGFDSSLEEWSEVDLWARLIEGGRGGEWLAATASTRGRQPTPPYDDDRLRRLRHLLVDKHEATLGRELVGRALHPDGRATALDRDTARPTEAP